MSHHCTSLATKRRVLRLAVLPLLAAAPLVAAPTALAAMPNAQGLVSSGGSTSATPTAVVADGLPRPSTRDTGRKTG